MKDILIYSSAWCPFCVRAKMLLDSKNLSYTELDVDQQPELRREMMERAQRHTVPQIFIGDHHVGGCDDLFALERAGELDPLLAD
ncbi:glutaredoxin 3 [Marinobacterium arenosum]|uniref:glutaredoxin 3 n=1 Tax=Marinobacterium arenosum TaxID=2862496 RepID=UPI001C947AA2|nr:glutaredoxin 3 [Marinobacterium arenosum]MBY4678910.1 glutaredoxin 3 [Marinobacterium arenosum]